MEQVYLFSWFNYKELSLQNQLLILLMKLIEQSKIKKLQKRFYGIMDEFRQMRRNLVGANQQQKQALVARAQELTTAEDNQQAMKEARDLQAQWKAVGPGSFRDDRKLWESFRAACDIIFSKRDAEKRDSHSLIENAVSRCRSIIAELVALDRLPDEELRDAQNRLKSLQRDFRDALDARIKKERKALQDEFYDAVRRIEARLKRLPDKKVMQLQQALAQRVAFCADLETRLLASDTDALIRELLSGVDIQAWEGLAVGHRDFDPLLEQRLGKLCSLESRQALGRMMADMEQQARTLCVETEIRAGLGSPPEDQAQRMQLQLAQLQSGFGRAQQATDDSLKFARDNLLRLMCLGPLDEGKRQQFRQRLENAIAKLA